VPSLTAAKKHEVTLYFTFLVRICLVFLFFFLLNCELSYTRFFFFFKQCDASIKPRTRAIHAPFFSAIRSSTCFPLHYFVTVVVRLPPTYLLFSGKILSFFLVCVSDGTGWTALRLLSFGVTSAVR
jgi:hypothetical protein